MLYSRVFQEWPCVRWRMELECWSAASFMVAPSAGMDDSGSEILFWPSTENWQEIWPTRRREPCCADTLWSHQTWGEMFKQTLIQEFKFSFWSTSQAETLFQPLSIFFSWHMAYYIPFRKGLCFIVLHNQNRGFHLSFWKKSHEL